MGRILYIVYLWLFFVPVFLVLTILTAVTVIIGCLLGGEKIFAYYPMILVVTLFYFIYRFDLFEKMSFVLVTCFFIYYLIYIFVPVAGPQFYFPAIGMDSVSQGVFPSIGDYFNHNQELLPGPGYQHGFFYSRRMLPAASIER